MKKEKIEPSRIPIVYRKLVLVFLGRRLTIYIHTVPRKVQAADTTPRGRTWSRKVVQSGLITVFYELH